MLMFHITIYDKVKADIYFNDESVVASSQREALLISVARCAFPPISELGVKIRQIAAL